MRFFVILCLLFVSFVCAKTPVAGDIIFTPFVNDDCTGDFGANVTIPTLSCLNNHDFNKVPCPTLTDCLTTWNIMSYEDLVDCTGAPAMDLSINATVYTDGSITVHSYALSTGCHGIPVPIFENVGDCSTFFAFNKECYPSGKFGFIPEY